MKKQKKKKMKKVPKKKKKKASVLGKRPGDYNSGGEPPSKKPYDPFAEPAGRDNAMAQVLGKRRGDFNSDGESPAKKPYDPVAEPADPDQFKARPRPRAGSNPVKIPHVLIISPISFWECGVTVH